MRAVRTEFHELHRQSATYLDTQTHSDAATSISERARQLSI